MGESFSRDGVTVHNWDAIDLYDSWEAPTVIVSDGAYGVSGFPGDPPTPEGLAKWYGPHIAIWSMRSSPMTTLWFWNTELGWATVHPVLLRHGWRFRNCHIWDKGMAHVAGNSNTQSLRKYPVVTEVCVQYVKEAEFRVGERTVGMKEWLRLEWKRSGLPFNKANEAAGVKNAATRKYLTEDHLWYFPPPEEFERLVDYANKHGRPGGRPYFSMDGSSPLTGGEWMRMRAKFYCDAGITNVWREPPLNGIERLKVGPRAVHLNQKPLKMIERIIKASSDLDDVVWEPFGGLCPAAVASLILGRRCRSAETDKNFYKLAVRRLASAAEGRAAYGLAPPKDMVEG